MDGDPLSLLIVILFTLLFSAFFSGMEIAFISANRLKIELDKKQGSIQGKILAYFVKKSPNFIATILLGKIVIGFCWVSDSLNSKLPKSIFLLTPRGPKKNP